MRFRLVEVVDDLDDEIVIDAVDSALFMPFEVVRCGCCFVRLPFDDKDESLEACGRLSIDDCDEAVREKC